MALDFAAGRTREILEGDEPDLSRPFVSGESLPAEPHEFIGGYVRVVTSDERYWPFSPFWITDLDYRSFRNRRMSQ